MGGNAFALIGAALAVGCCCTGSAFGVFHVQRASCGIIAEKPEKYSKTLILQLIPSSSALYGFIVAFLVLVKAVLGNSVYTINEGLMVLGGCLAVAIAGTTAAIAQGKVCASAVVMVGKRDDAIGRAITMAVFTELFALFGLIISILCVLLIPATAVVA